MQATAPPAVAPRADAEDRPDWRVWFGLGSTVFWLSLGIWYLHAVIGWGDFLAQPADALGGFLEGAFAPLAFLWLVIGFFLQQGELRENNRAIAAQYEQMRRTAENAEIQATAIRANALHQQQETTLMVADRVHVQLGAVAGLLWMSSQFTGDSPEVDEAQVNELWSRLGMGDPEAFARNFMALYFRNQGDPAAVWDLFFGTEVRARHSDTIAKVFGRLLEKVRECDPDGTIEDALRGSAHGLLYGYIESVRAAGPGGGSQQA